MLSVICVQCGLTCTHLPFTDFKADAYRTAASLLQAAFGSTLLLTIGQAYVSLGTSAQGGLQVSETQCQIHFGFGSRIVGTICNCDRSAIGIGIILLVDASVFRRLFRASYFDARMPLICPEIQAFVSRSLPDSLSDRLCIQGFSAGLRARARHASQYITAAKSAASVLSVQRKMEKQASQVEKVWHLTGSSACGPRGEKKGG